MKYILNNQGYVVLISFGGSPNFNNSPGTLYTGTIPDGYDSLKDWSEEANIRAYKIVEGNLEYDASKDAELQENDGIEATNNSFTTKKYVDDKTYGLSAASSQELSSMFKESITGISRIIKLTNSSNFNIEKIKITSINDLSGKVKLVVTGGNMLPNTASSTTNNGLTYIQTADRSIKISGTSTAISEVNLAGNSSNLVPIMLFKRNIEYILSGLADNVSLKFYNYDGENRTLVGTYENEIITLSSDSSITQITMYIASGIEIDTTIFPMLELGTTASDYEEYQEQIVALDLGEYTFEAYKGYITLEKNSAILTKALFPGAGVFPSSTIFPMTPTNYYLTSINLPTTFNPKSHIYSLSDITLQVTYRTNEQIDVPYNRINLEGYITANGNFEIDLEGNMKAKNGTFQGDVTADNLYLTSGGKVIGGEGLLTTMANVSGSDLDYTGLDYSTTRMLVVKRNQYLGVNIPANFTIVSAVINLLVSPVYYTDAASITGSANNFWGWCRNLRLYKVSNSNQKFISHVGSDFVDDSDDDYSTEITGAFGSSGYTYPTPSDTSYAMQNVTSIDIKDQLTTGFNRLKVATGDNTSSYSSMYEAYQRQGKVMAFINIIGYTNYEE